MRDVKIAPSILAANAAKLAEEVQNVEKAGADWIHLDIMDGHFVPNLSYSAVTVKALRPYSNLVFDVHLMITDPEKYIDMFVSAGADIITIHYEAVKDIKKLREIAHILHCKGVKAGISVKPKTNIRVIEDVLDVYDLVLIMTVEPGFGGQSYMEDMAPKITWLAMTVDAKQRNVDIEVDGGIGEKTIKHAAEAGANIFVAGSSVFGADNYDYVISNLKKIAKDNHKTF
ncbi:MAG: ribulose-phosphate 3-epimerase [Ruminococcaceae bacterium]|nr:ribulose-phosphate 3-epimerase [Oscillospiraceae bacterium]